MTQSLSSNGDIQGSNRGNNQGNSSSGSQSVARHHGIQNSRTGSSQKPPNGDNKKKRPVSFWIAIVVATVAFVACAVFAFMAFTGDQSGKPARDPNGAVGQLEGKTPEEIQEELNHMVEEGMFNIKVSKDISMKSGDAEAELLIENSPSNPYLMQVTITRDDTGEAIYTSGIIEQNYHIQKAKLDVDLPAGDYECTATFKALDPETEEEVGQAAAKTTIHVAS